MVFYVPEQQMPVEEAHTMTHDEWTIPTREFVSVLRFVNVGPDKGSLLLIAHPDPSHEVIVFNAAGDLVADAAVPCVSATEAVRVVARHLTPGRGYMAKVYTSPDWAKKKIVFDVRDDGTLDRVPA